MFPEAPRLSTIALETVQNPKNWCKSVHFGCHNGVLQQLQKLTLVAIAGGLCFLLAAMVHREKLGV